MTKVEIEQLKDRIQGLSPNWRGVVLINDGGCFKGKTTVGTIYVREVNFLHKLIRSSTWSKKASKEEVDAVQAALLYKSYADPFSDSTQLLRLRK